MVKWNISKRSHHVNEPMCNQATGTITVAMTWEIFAITCPREVPGGRYSGMRLIKARELSEN